MGIQEEALALHAQWQGKLSIDSKVPIKNKDDLSVAYTPGVAEPCRRIHQHKIDVYKYTGKGNMVAVVTDGSAVLGLGDIGPEAALPVMEGKAVLFKEFAGVDAFPICIPSNDIEAIITTVKMIEPGFGGINLEDIASPRCVEIERRLKEALDIPVFHDDQHGTAVVLTAALMNALKVVGKNLDQVTVAISGAGAAGSAIVKMLLNVGVKDIVACSSKGILSKDESYPNWVHQEIAEMTNDQLKKGSLADALKDADVFIGVSAPDIVTGQMIETMADDPIVLPMANPDPEIDPQLAKQAGAAIVGTGRSDYPNQINNVLAFPGIFRGALDARASDINEAMKVAAAKAIADLIAEDDLRADYIIVSPFDSRVAGAVAKAVYQAAIDSLVARLN